MGGTPTMRELTLLLLAFAITTGAPRMAAAQFNTGDMIDKNNWQKAENLLPPEILRHYKDGEYANKFVDWPMSKFNHPPDFKAGSEANAGKFTTSPEGTISDKSTGKQPDYVIGFPFPQIDPSEPDAGVKILWNFFYRTWYFGNIEAESQVNWVAPTGLERRAD